MNFYSFAGFLNNEYQGWISAPYNDDENIRKGFKKLNMNIDSYMSCEVYMDGTIKIIPPDRDLYVQK